MGKLLQNCKQLECEILRILLKHVSNNYLSGLFLLAWLSVSLGRLDAGCLKQIAHFGFNKSKRRIYGRTVKVGAINRTANFLTSFWIMPKIGNRIESSIERYNKHKSIAILNKVQYQYWDLPKIRVGLSHATKN